MRVDVSRALIDELETHLPSAIEIRHQIHMNPRLSGNEGATRDLLVDALGMEATSVAQQGALVRVDGVGPAVGLRAEIDALPIEEASDWEWASRNPGVMHACGHDIHAAAVFAVLRACAAVSEAPSVVGIIQPREESWPSGAKDVIESGLLEKLDVASVVGIHVQPAIGSGVVACAPGPVNASADEFEIRIRGVAGHAAYPHRGNDPIVAAAEVIIALQHIVSRNLDAMKPGLLTVGMVSAGSASNVIPEEAVIRGTFRAMEPDVRSLLATRLREVAMSVARAHRCEALVDVVLGDPPLINDIELALSTQPHLKALGFEVLTDYRSMGADDFAFYCERFPSLMMFLGTEGTALHHPEFAPPDDLIKSTALALIAGVVGARSQFE